VTNNKKGIRTKLAVAAAGLFVLQGAVAHLGVFPLWSKNYSPVQKGRDLVSGALSADQMLFALAGFREMIAGILWVRADSFFDTGNYDAILPIIRLVTLLDPHQIDVYSTGMWHIGYNFTDEEQRSDRRYIPSALALGKEGAAQNPNTYELFFETAWMWYHKVDDNYDQSVSWMKKAYERPDILPARKNLLCRLYERNGQVEESVKNWYSLLGAAEEAVAADKDERNYSLRSGRDTIENNLDTTLVRMVQRGFMAAKEGRSLEGYDINPPFNVGFSAKVTVVAPKVLRVQGTWNVLPVGTRIRCVLRDADYPDAVPAGMKWDQEDGVNLDPPRDRTFMQEQLFVKNQRFDKKVDMSRDPTMYPFVPKDYVIEFYYNPRSAPAHMQDKFGWNGEGMTDVTASHVNNEVRAGQKVIYAKLTLTRDQILMRGEWADKAPIVKTVNFADTDKSYNKTDVPTDIPSLRTGN
jgi:hypothetical protein